VATPRLGDGSGGPGAANLLQKSLLRARTAITMRAPFVRQFEKDRPQGDERLKAILPHSPIGASDALRGPDHNGCKRQTC